MKLGDNRWHSKYICDKCGKEIKYIGQQGFIGINHYYKSTQRETIKRAFDLCSRCEKKFEKWLKTKETQNIINMFEIYKGAGTNDYM